MRSDIVYMDINALSSIVGTLILDRDDIALPHFGVFEAELVGAAFSDRGYSVNPPYRQLHFTAADCEDGLLYKAVAEQEGISEEDAIAEIDSCIQELKKKLATLGTAELPGLGKFRTTRDGDCLFIMDPDACIYPDGWGLPGVSLKNRERQHSISEIKVVESPVLDLSEEGQGLPAEDIVVELDPTPGPVSEPEPSPAPTPTAKKRSLISGLLLAVVIIVLLAFVALRLLGIYAPDFIDSILYSPEELEQLHKSL